MIKPKHLKKGDKVAIVSLSSGILGEPYCEHQLKRGIERLESFGLHPVMMKHTLKGVKFLSDHPELRAQDLKDAFNDDTIKGIICAIGGDETYRLLPYLLSDESFMNNVKKHPKIFTGFSDTTNNHLMFYKLGLMTYYGPNFLSDLCELESDMLPYTKKAFELFLSSNSKVDIPSSPIWYGERRDFSIKALDQKRIAYQEERGYDVIHGEKQVSGELLGGCLESLYDAYTGTRYQKQKEIYQTYQLMPKEEEWKEKILFIETSEEQPTPELFETYLSELENQGIFKSIKAMIVGKPQNEVYYEAYRTILSYYARKHQLPIIINVNFGHAYPRFVIPYGAKLTIDFDQKKLTIEEPICE